MHTIVLGFPTVVSRLVVFCVRRRGWNTSVWRVSKSHTRRELPHSAGGFGFDTVEHRQESLCVRFIFQFQSRVTNLMRECARMCVCSRDTKHQEFQSQTPNRGLFLCTCGELVRAAQHSLTGKDRILPKKFSVFFTGSSHIEGFRKPNRRVSVSQPRAEHSGWWYFRTTVATDQFEFLFFFILVVRGVDGDELILFCTIINNQPTEIREKKKKYTLRIDRDDCQYEGG